jgi:hypothetical protein
MDLGGTSPTRSIEQSSGCFRDVTWPAMKTQLLEPASHGESVCQSWLNRPLSSLQCALGWLVAVATFMGSARLLGGPTTGDAAESFYSTWAIAHGDFACAYPPSTKLLFYPLYVRGASIAPVWPLISGGLAAILRIGHKVPFPSRGALGPHCSTALDAMYQWAGPTRPTLPTVGLGYVSWFALMAGVVALLRTTRRGRCGWEPAVLVFLALVPQVWMTLVFEFHPQDILAMGFAFGGVACVRRDSWAWAGVLLGLALMTQQFSLLVIVPLVVVAPSNRRVRFSLATIVTAGLIGGPLILVTSGQAFTAVFLGSGNSPNFGYTWLLELHPHGVLLLALSRMLPILLSGVLARWAVRRLGPGVLEPVPLVALLTTSLCLRLVFEQSLFGYYFMALAVSLIMLDVVRGQIRGPMLAWLALGIFVFNPVPFGEAVNAEPWGFDVATGIRFALMASVIVIIVRDAFHLRIRAYLAAWFVLVALSFFNWPPWADLPFRHPLPIWWWQLALVGSGLALAIGPLISSIPIGAEAATRQDLASVPAAGATAGDGAGPKNDAGL